MTTIHDVTKGTTIEFHSTFRPIGVGETVRVVTKNGVLDQEVMAGTIRKITNVITLNEQTGDTEMNKIIDIV